MANPYTFGALGERWSDGDPTTTDNLNKSRIKNDYLKWELENSRLFYDGIVDAGGDANYSTIQAGDDDLDAGAYTMLVKSGTYGAGFTVSTNNAKIVVEPGTTIQAAITLSGNNITLVLGAGCDVQGLVTLSGIGCSFKCENGCDFDGIDVTGADCLVDGGGWESITTDNSGTGSLYVNGARAIVRNIYVNTTAGSGIRGLTIGSGGVNSQILNCKIVSALSSGLAMAADECLAFGCHIEGYNGPVEITSGHRNRVIGCHCLNTVGSGQGFYVVSDNNSINGNHIEGSGGSGVLLTAGGDNNIIDGNIMDYGISDSGTGNTLGDNEIY